MMWASTVVVIFALLLSDAFGQSQGVIKIHPEDRELLVGEGNTQVLDCHITVASQQADLSWRGPKGNLGSKTQTDNNGNGIYTIHRILTIEDFSNDDVGDYECTYKAATPQTARIKLSSVRESVTDATYYFRNKTGLLECELIFSGGQKTSNFKEWLKFGEPLPTDDERFNDYENGTLLIENPTREDAGLYTAIFTITGMASSYEHNCTVEYFAGPLILNLVKSKNIDEGDNLVIECDVKGYPQATITWYKDDEILVEDKERILIERYKGVKDTKLTVKKLMFSDAGVYGCEANLTDFESDKKTLIVRVKDKLAWLWPLIGIVCEVILLAVIIFTCNFLQKKRQAQDDDNEPRRHNKDN